MGRFRTKSLFWELRNIDNEIEYPPIFTIKDFDHTILCTKTGSLVTYPSLRAVYLSYDHVPGVEYEFAMDVFGSWEHWLVLCATSSSSTGPMIQKWRDELQIKQKATAIKKMIELSQEEGPASLSAARYMADEAYTKPKVGRLTKEEKERQIKIEAGVRDTLSADMERLGLEVITGARH